MGSEAEFYERLWRRGEGRESAARAGFQRPLIEAALRRTGAGPGRTVLEVGPGPGREALLLAAAGAFVPIVDLSVAALAGASAAAPAGRSGRIAPGIAPVLARAEALPLRDASVDCVFVQTTLMHLDLSLAFAEWARVLKPGGAVVVLEPLAGHPLLGLYRRFLSPYRVTGPRYVTLERLESASPRLRLAEHEEHYLLAVLALALPGALGRLLALALAPLDRLLLKLPPLRRRAWMTLAVLRPA